MNLQDNFLSCGVIALGFALVGCTSEPDPSEELSAPPAGHCEALCNKFDEVNQALECDVDFGTGSYTVDVPACIEECDQAKSCMDLRVAWDNCRIGLGTEDWQCSAYYDSVPLADECIDEYYDASDCVNP